LFSDFCRGKKRSKKIAGKKEKKETLVASTNSVCSCATENDSKTKGPIIWRLSAYFSGRGGGGAIKLRAHAWVISNQDGAQDETFSTNSVFCTAMFIFILGKILIAFT